jgi:uncharacterized protein with von Willebrand factor type A (vWA) domain
MSFGKKRKRKDFMSEWLDGPRVPDPSKLSKFTVDHDKWDAEDESRLREEMVEYAAEAERLCDVVETGNGLWTDAYFALSKVQPKPKPEGDIRPSYLINKTVMEEAMELKEYEELRSLGTVGDDVAAAMGVITMRPDLETLYDKMKAEQELAKQMEEQMQELFDAEQEAADLDGMMSALTDPNATDEEKKEATNYQEQQAKLNEQIQKLREELGKQGQELQEALDAKRPSIRTSMKQAMDKAGDEAGALQNSCDTWGLEPGALQRLPHKERMDLAKRLNNPRLRKIAELFGPMKRLMFTEQRRRVNHAIEEVYDIELGNNLDRVLPQEFAKLSHPLRKYEFYKDFSERRLPQYKMRGEEKVGKGPIIFCEDGSGSMSGDRELWAKAVGLCLLHLARQQKRAFKVIHFGSSHEIWQADFSKPEDFSVDKIIDFAEFFYGGGTDFMRPLSIALDHIRDEFDSTGAAKSDIVFATDGACGVQDAWLAEFIKEKERMAFTVWGVSIGGHYADEPLKTICSGKVIAVKDLHGGEDIRGVFGGIGGA